MDHSPRGLPKGMESLPYPLILSGQGNLIEQVIEKLSQLGDLPGRELEK